MIAFEVLAQLYATAALIIGAALVLQNRERLARLGFWKQMLLFATAPAILISEIFKRRQA